MGCSAGTTSSIGDTCGRRQGFQNSGEHGGSCRGKHGFGEGGRALPRRAEWRRRGKGRRPRRASSSDRRRSLETVKRSAVSSSKTEEEKTSGPDHVVKTEGAGGIGRSPAISTSSGGVAASRSSFAGAAVRCAAALAPYTAGSCSPKHHAFLEAAAPGLTAARAFGLTWSSAPRWPMCRRFRSRLAASSARRGPSQR